MSGTLEADRNRSGEEAEGDEAEEKDDVADTENAFGEFSEVRHDSESVDQFHKGPENKPAAFHAHEEFTDVRKSAQPDHHTKGNRNE